MPLSASERYGKVAMTLHWVIALLILGLLIIGFYMGSLGHTDPLKFKLYQLHKSFGITVLALSLIRLGWRLTHPAPPLPSTLKKWEKFAAHAVHGSLYGFMIGMPLIGWLGVSASPMKIPTRIFGLFTLPPLPIFSGHEDPATVHSSAHAVSESFFKLHSALAWVAIGLLALHVGAALKHHFFDKDDVIFRMMPRFLHGLLRALRGQNA